MYALCTAKVNQLKMCRNRGLTLSQQEERVLDQVQQGYADEDLVEFFTSRYITRETTRAKRVQVSELCKEFSSTAKTVMTSPEGERTCVFFLHNDKASLGKHDVEVSLGTARTLNCGTCILVSERGYSDEAAKYVAESPTRVDFFLHASLQFDLAEHKMVPRHERCTEDEKRALYAQTGVNAMRLPILTSADPVAVYYGWRTGTLVRITRDYSFLDMPSPYSISYRIVI